MRHRRAIFQGCVAMVCAPLLVGRTRAGNGTTPVTLLNAPIELAGDWGRMVPDAAVHVLERMRQACLNGIRLVSEDQPDRLRVEEHAHFWIAGRFGFTPTARALDGLLLTSENGIGRNWPTRSATNWATSLQLPGAQTLSRRCRANGSTTRWLKRFSLRGLALLADDWSRNPPFPDDSGFGANLATYRQNIVQRYGKLAQQQGNPHNLGAWFREHRATIETQALGPFAQAASLTILAEYERDPAGLEALGALNRWRGSQQRRPDRRVSQGLVSKLP